MLSFFFAGDVVCSRCQHIFSFSAVEKFFAKSHRSTDFDRARDLFMKSKPKIKSPTIVTIQKEAEPIILIPNHELLEIFQHLRLQKIEPDVFNGIQAFGHAKRKTLYFPMVDIDSNIVGYKKLTRPNDESSKIIETTIPEENSFGAVIFSPVNKRGNRDHKTAVLVLNILDALALRMEKSNC